MTLLETFIRLITPNHQERHEMTQNFSNIREMRVIRGNRT